MSRVDLSQRSGLDFVEMAYARQVRKDDIIVRGVFYPFCQVFFTSTIQFKSSP